jgi:hypothetical protein
MADAVTTRVLFAGEKKYVVQYTNLSDGNGEAAVNKLDISTLTNKAGDAVTAIKLNKIWGNVSGMVVQVLTDHTADVLMHTLNDGICHLDFTSFGGKKDTGTGGPGDVLFTTSGAGAGDSYDITIEYGLKY